MSWLMIFALMNAVMTISGFSGELREYSYHNDEKLKKIVEDVLSEMEDDDIHSRIFAVNEAHRKYHDQIQATKTRAIDVADDIIETNLEQGVNLFEGDIDLTPEEAEMIKETGTLQKRTAGHQNTMSLWHNRLVPYMIAPSLRTIDEKGSKYNTGKGVAQTMLDTPPKRIMVRKPANHGCVLEVVQVWNSNTKESKRHLIRQAVSIFHRETCLKFTEISRHISNYNYIYIDSRDGCHSKIGKVSTKKQQLLSLGFGCHDVGTILHEMTHAIGFWHEQGRPDRDKYVRVRWENIIPGLESNFKKHHISSVNTLNLPYDYGSIMHYGQKSFTINGGNTIEKIDDPKFKLGSTSNEFSAYDKTAINALYECTKFPGSYRGFSSWSKWLPCGWNCKRWRERFCMNVANDYWRKKLCPGADRDGVHMEFKQCSKSECGPIDGGWSMWGAWSKCNAKCGPGTRTRKRTCNSPYPMRDGKKCPGSETGTGKCTVGKCRLGFHETQFDNYKTGSWKVKGSGYKIWTVKNSWRDPGPKGDHTSGHGMWLYYPTARKDFQQYPNHKASLVNTFGWGNPFCLTFWYVMDGPSVGTLTVNIKITMRNDKRQWTVFTAKGSKGREWHFAEVFINVKDKNFQISIDAVGSGSKEEGVIGLDDIYILNSKCPSIPVAPPPTTAPCVDINQKCQTWAYAGECAKRPTYMNKFCRKSCVCQPVQCKDFDKRKCAYWTIIGECEKNPVWMKKNCCLSCRSGCVNNKKWASKCPGFVAKGECTTRKDWMGKNCCKSCRERGKPCFDNKKWAAKCPGFAAKGECTKFVDWMAKNCCKSCRAIGK